MRSGSLPHLIRRAKTDLQTEADLARAAEEIAAASHCVMLAMPVVDKIVQLQKLLADILAQNFRQIRRVGAVVFRRTGVRVDMHDILAIQKILNIKIHSHRKMCNAKRTVGTDIEPEVPWRCRRADFSMEVDGTAQQPAEREIRSAQGVAGLAQGIGMAAVKLQQCTETGVAQP